MLEYSYDAERIKSILLSLPKNEYTFSDYLIARVVSLGCNQVFTLTGGGVMYLVDSIYQQKLINPTFVHNEQFAGAAADGYARTNSSIGFAIGTTGPGLANLFTSVLAAYQDSSPVLFIGGQVKKSDSSKINNLDVRQNGTFEFDSLEVFSNVCKRATIAESHEEGVFELEKSIFSMLDGRFGPCVLEVPLDVQGELIDIDYCIDLGISYYKKSQKELIGSIDENKLLEEINSSNSPLFLLGNGVIRAGLAGDYKRLLNKLNLPYVVTPQAIELSNANGNFAGVIGLRGNRSANIASQQSDHLFVVGSSLHQQTVGWEYKKFANSSKKTWYDIDPASYHVRGGDLAVTRYEQSGCREVLEALSKLDDITLKSEWLEYLGKIIFAFKKHRPENKNAFNYYDAIDLLTEINIHVGALTTDAGSAWYIVPQAFDVGMSNIKFVSSGSLGAMGMALPYAIGAAKATKNDKYALAITGDGSLMTCLQELGTLAESKDKVILAVMNNSGYKSIKVTHDKFFEGRRIGTDSNDGVFIPCFKELASTFNLSYIKVENVNDFEQVKSSINAGQRKMFVEFVVDENTPIEPAVVSVLESGKFVTPSIDVMHPTVEYPVFKPRLS